MDIYEYYAQIDKWSTELVKLQLEMENQRRKIEKQILNPKDSTEVSERCSINYSPGPPQGLAITTNIYPPKIQVSQTSLFGKSRSGPSVYGQVRDLWLTTIGDALMREPIKLKEPIQDAIVWFLFRYPDKRCHDPDNYSIKFIHDILIKCNILEDDDYRCLKYIAEGCHHDTPGTIIVVTENVGQLDIIRPNFFNMIR